MILDVLEHQCRELEDQIRVHTEGLVRGTGSRDDDQRTRGIIYGLRLAIGRIEDTIERVKRAQNED
jgi:hypothetical protein